MAKPPLVAKPLLVAKPELVTKPPLVARTPLFNDAVMLTVHSQDEEASVIEGHSARKLLAAQ